MKERNIGIDLLRIISMMGIVMLHLLKDSGLLEFDADNITKWSIVWVVEIIVFCSVNVFGIISGFVGVNSNYNYSRMVEIWIQMLFYLYCFFALSKIINTSYQYTLKDIIFPINSNYYWYVTAYAGLFLFIPLLNIGINNIDIKTFRIMLIFVLIFMCLIPCVVHSDPYQINAGYSCLWIIICYLIGGYINKSCIYKKKRYRTLIFFMVLSVLILVVSKLGVDLLLYKISGQAHGGGTFVSYVSPFIVLNAAIIVCVFAKLKIKHAISTKIIKTITPTVLGVFLIHANPVFGELLFYRSAQSLKKVDGAFLPIVIIGYTIMVFITCSIIDFTRNILFEILRIKKIIRRIDKNL